MSLDVVGYSAMMRSDETGTLDAMGRVRHDVFEPCVAENRGRVVKLMGDGALVEFPSIVGAALCGIKIQNELAEKNLQLPDGTRIRVRIGINIGDIIIQGKDIFGDGVNLASRLQEFAMPGGVAICAASHEYTSKKLPVEFVDAGQHELKNIDTPIRIFHWPEHAGIQSAHKLPDKPSIVVLPFDNMSGDPDQEFFADGVVETLTATLSRIRSFFVIARNSSFAYKGRHMNVADIGRELGVSYALEGSVQRAGTRLRITVQLVETDSGAHLWAEKYDGTIDDLFELQDEITERVAGALQPSIRLAEIERARRKPPQSLTAYDHTMQAMQHVWTLKKEETARALNMLEQALAADPDYPLALALAGWCWAQRSVYAWVPDTDAALDRAVEQARRAQALSSDDPLILSILGTVHCFARDFQAARGLLERAIALDPNSAWTLCRLGWLEVYTGHPGAAIECFQKALRLSPLDPMNFNVYAGWGSACQTAGDDAEAVDLFQRALREQPSAIWIHRQLAGCLYAIGRQGEAQASVAAFLAEYPDATLARIRHVMVLVPNVVERLCDQLRALGVPEG